MWYFVIFDTILQIFHVSFDWVHFSPDVFTEQSEFLVGYIPILVSIKVIEDGFDVLERDLDPQMFNALSELIQGKGKLVIAIKVTEGA